jgi:trehalose 6-phosphate phosphatase
MEYLFTRAGLSTLQEYCRPQALLAFDYDGTLARIVPVRSQAEMAAPTARLLTRLIGCATVAVVSGRAAADVMRFLPAQPAFVVGNHGIEGTTVEGFSADGAIDMCRAWSAALEPCARALPGVEIEDKTYSLAVHYRRALRKEQARSEILKWIGHLNPIPRLTPGKEVLNLLPPNAPNKGDAVHSLICRTRVETAVYVGDDDTDEDVFNLEDARILTIRAGCSNTSRARYFIENQTEIDRLLEAMLDLLDEHCGDGRIS